MPKFPQVVRFLTPNSEKKPWRQFVKHLTFNYHISGYIFFPSFLKKLYLLTNYQNRLKSEIHFSAFQKQWQHDKQIGFFYLMLFVRQFY